LRLAIAGRIGGCGFRGRWNLFTVRIDLNLLDDLQVGRRRASVAAIRLGLLAARNTERKQPRATDS
jgi:hypothetical protein